MDNIIKFTIYAEPKTQKGVRSSIIRSKKTGRQFILHYPDKDTEAYKERITPQLLQHQQIPLLECPVRLRVSFYLPIPKSMTKSLRQQAEAEELYKAKKPDLSNLEKVLEDTLTGIIWKDDALIVSKFSNKFYSKNPRTDIEITPCPLI